MGIMSNKVTRRVAIGSIVGGLAATPFVLNAIRKTRKTTSADEYDFDREWEMYSGKTEVVIRDIDGNGIDDPTEFSAKGTSPAGTPRPFTCLLASFDGPLEPPSVASRPAMFHVREGSVKLRRNSSGNSSVLGSTVLNRVFHRTGYRGLSTGDWILPLHDEWAESETRSPGAAENGQLVPAAGAFRVAEMARRQLGANWNVPGELLKLPSTTEVTCRVAGLADVDGVVTVKVQMAASPKSTPTSKDSASEIEERLIALGHPRATAERIASELAEAVREVQVKGSTEVEGFVYVDMHGGNVVRMEATSILKLEDETKTSQLVYQATRS